VGLQGGTERIKQIYKASTLRDIDINGIWIQDWSGQIFTEFGDRVFWNWEWNRRVINE
jgi:alpha-glucosidase